MRNLKRVLSLALALVMVLGMMVIGTSAATYTDDAEIEYKEAVAVMTGIGLFEGNPDGSLAPKQVLTRAMAATILARVKLGDKVETLKATQEIFSDVPTKEWYAPAVQYCYNTGLIDGNGDGTFNPMGELTGIAFAKLLLVALGYDADAQGYVGKDWAANIAVDALNNNLYIEGVDIADKLTREQAAQMLLQVMNSETVYNTKFFDKATNSYILALGGYDGETFRSTYYDFLKYEENGHDIEDWGRPYDYRWYINYTTTDDWKYGVYDEILWTEKEEVRAVYTTAVKECEVASEIGMNYGVDLTWKFTTFTNGHREKTVNYKGETVDALTYIEAIDTKGTIGAQGRRTEVYYDTIVYIDTFLAKVTKVEDVKFDAAGHQINYAAREIEYYGLDAQGKSVTYSFRETKKTNYDNKVGQYLLINVSTLGAASDNVAMGDYAPALLEVIGEPKTQAAAQTVIWRNEAKHTIDNVTYDDAFKFSLDAAQNTPYTPFTWFYDQYNNVIGSASITTIPVFATIANIQWYNPAFTNGYALATLVYVDGSTEQVVVNKIGDKTLSYTLFTGDPATGAVSMNYASNNAYIGDKLYVVAKGANGVATLTAVEDYATGVKVAKGNPVVDHSKYLYIDDSTQFLVRTGTNASNYVYTPVTGYNQIATLENATVYYVERDGDWAADIVYVYGSAPAASSVQNLVFIANSGYNYETKDPSFIKMLGAEIMGVNSPVVINAARFDGTKPDVEVGKLYFMKDTNGDGKVDVTKGELIDEITATAYSLGNGVNAKRVDVENYIVLNNALYVDGEYVQYNITNAVKYGTWTGAEDIVIVYKDNVVSAIYVLFA